MRKAKEGEITADVFSFLTCQPNLEIAKPHPKSMPVILTTERSMMSRCGHHGIKPNRYNGPLPDESLRIVTTGDKQDGITG